MTGNRCALAAGNAIAWAMSLRPDSGKQISDGRCPRRHPGRISGWAPRLGAVAAGILVILAAPSARANGGDPGTCVIGPSHVVTCTGDQSDGVSYPSNSTITNLNVNSSTDIQPQAGKQGIFLQSSGTAPAPVPNPVLGIPIPGDGSGGDVVVNSFNNITTAGNKAHGIEAQSSTSGYKEPTASQLQDFINNDGEANIAFSVVTVAGAPGSVDHPVAGILIGDDGLPVKDDLGNEVDGGIFTINADGTFAFEFGTAFDDLAVGDVSTTRLVYEVEMSKVGTTDPVIRSEGFLVVNVTRISALDEDGEPVTELVIERPVDPDTGDEGPERKEAQFLDFGGSAKPVTEGTVFPDLTGYAERLLADALQGGAGSSVNVDSEGAIETSGVEAHGILAQSQGAPGGNGANANRPFLCIGSTPSKPGGTGKRGGNVSVTTNGSITTTGASSTGVTALSRAGNGGKGGDASACRWASKGGTGGNGGNVEIKGSANIHTHTTEKFASGVLAFSEGGNGGNAGGGSYWHSGGQGGSGGKGGNVVVDGNWTITTEGDKAHGIWAKSMGGNAGAGGSGGWLFGSPGGGGIATDGGSVTVTSDGAIETWGKDSYGINAQSVGGFGGKGGEAADNLFYSAGGDGNSAGSGGHVTVTNGTNGDIVTHGERSHAIYAQSVGGGGGNAGGSGNIGLIGVGGKGASGGKGGTVTVTNNGRIEASGRNARGIYAQSIGGGGGDGGDATGLGAIGGKGSGTSDGGVVTVTNNANGLIVTHGERSNAIFAQSIGGGGGDGGDSTGLISIGGDGGGGGAAKTVTVNNKGQLTTSGADSSAVFAQSVGGGGGNGGGSVAVGVGVSVAIGGKGAAGGVGGTVIVNDVANINDLTVATIETGGDRSHGIQVQSVGGGGGNGGFAFSASVSGGASASIALGGRGGGGGASGAVTVNEKGAVTTGGEGAIGIFAQSVGGGGGNGGGTVAASVGGAYNLSVAIGGKGGLGGPGNTATVNAIGNITTTGAQSHAIMAQSVGGGGGNGGYSVAAAAGGLSGSVALGGGAGTGGIGSTVTVNATGVGFVDPTISTSGEGAIGILAQSVGGGGGNGGLAGTIAAGSGGIGVSLGGKGGSGATGGTVTVTNRNIMKTTGNGASAIFAQSVGGGGGNGGAALSGAGGVVGISVAVGGSGGGGSNGGTVTVDNYGSITTGYAVESVVDDVIVEELFGNRSYGIFAQSVGGGGGNGGFAIAGAIGVSIPDIPGGAAAISVGGTGGGASDGELVTVNTHGGIETYGLGSHAIFAQSVGGGGGNGGFAGSVAMTVGGGAAVGVAVGGGGSGGGNAGIVNVNTFDALQSIITHADGADGVHAQSVGGGGGDGGFAMAGAFGFGGEVSVNVAVAIGGAGGEGGTGNEVNVTTRQAITTYGQNSNGVMAQSVGGGGGNGGMAVTGTLAFAETAGAVGVSVGGAGGTGSIGNTVTVDNYGQITTLGNDAIGIMAQSVGGSGGNGGLAVAAQMTGTTKKSATVGVSIGGGAGDGNFGGIVNVTNHSLGAIVTNGLGAHGIKAQSIGGGGGNGGMAIVAQLGTASGTSEQATKTLNVGVSVGGSGGTGGYGNTAHVINDGSIIVGGAAATGIFAQSVGGGGGDGGGAVSAVGMLSDSANSDSRSLVATVTVGGGGGSGNYGGAVTVDNTGSVVTSGVSGHGIYAQSIGGGGGVGGRANTIQMLVTKPVSVPETDEVLTNKNNVQLGVTIGGDGGTGGHGGNVIVNNEGTIETWNELSNGIFAQSVGAGGGDGGNGTLGDGGLPIEGTTKILDKAAGKFGLVGAVKKYKNIQVAVGGDNGATGHGGTVEVNNDKDITTHGSNSDGIFAQSVGGGGGVGGKAVIGAKLALGIGGKGGAAGNGGAVTVNQTDGATIETFGVASNGIFAQSVGGGGGIAGNVDRKLTPAKQTSIPGVTIPSMNVGIGLALGQGGGDGGDGGPVDVDLDGRIITHGDNAPGIFAQSVGGGGGVLGELGNELPVLSLLSWAIGSNGDAGNAGQVDVDLTGSIMTAGNNATGIFAQSAGGTGTAGAVNVTLNGSILTGEVLQAGDEDRGLGSIGILAQSVAVDNANNGDITVAINSTDGVVRGGQSQVVDVDREYIGVGIWVMDGDDNTITNNGLVTTLGGVTDGFAILATGSDATHLGGNETVSNFGTVTGNVDLGAGTNAFDNYLDSTFNSGTAINLGSGNSLTNDGTLSPGGDGFILTTGLTGDLLQTGTGTYAVDLDPENGATDRIDISGTADLDGDVFVNVINAGYAMPGTHESILLSGAGGATDSGLGLDYEPTAVADYALSFSSPTDVTLTTTIDYSPKGLTGNNSAIGRHINDIQTAGGSESFAPIAAALYVLPDAAALGEAMETLSPEPYLDSQAVTLYSNQRFTNAMLSCREREGTYRFAREGECGWMDVSLRRLDGDRTANNAGFEEQALELAGGRQFAVGDDLYAGFALSWEGSNLDVEDLASVDGDRLQAGVVVKKLLGATKLSGAVSGGVGFYEAQRFLTVPVPGTIASGDQRIGFVSGDLRASHDFEGAAWYVRPIVGAQFTYARFGAFNETGAGAGNLSIAAGSDTYWSGQAALEFGGELKENDNLLVRPFVRVGVTHFFSDTSPNITASLQGAPAGVQPFTITGETDETVGDVMIGFDFLSAEGATNSINMRLSFSGRFGDRTEQGIIGLRGSIRF